jgi:pimeloyl-ACP methyl ester carboxylesterase/GNAT superfamily N-acetyltransferase
MVGIEMSHAGIAWAEAGSGQPVALLHASASSSAQWQELTQALQIRFRVFTPDLHGHGGSAPWRGPAPLTMADEAAIVTALADRAGEPVHLIGHSYGAAVALRFAQAHPERLRSLVLIEPAAFNLLRENDPEHATLRAEIEDLAAAVTRAAGEGVGDMRRFVDFWNGNGTWTRMSGKSRATMNGRAHLVAAHFNAILGDVTPLDAYAVVRTPTLVLCGTESPAPMSPIVAALTSVLPRVRMLRVFGAGHMLPNTHADAVNPSIVAHLNNAATSVLSLQRLDGSDLIRVNRHLLALDRADRHARFGTACDDTKIIGCTRRIDPSRAILIGAVERASGHIVGLAEAHPAIGASRRMELAVSVDRPLRRRGLGLRLVGEAAAVAFERGAEVLAFFFDPDNRPVVGLARRFRVRVDAALGCAEIHRRDATVFRHAGKGGIPCRQGDESRDHHWSRPAPGNVRTMAST